MGIAAFNYAKSGQWLLSHYRRLALDCLSPLFRLVVVLEMGRHLGIGINVCHCLKSKQGAVAVTHTETDRI